MAIPSEAIPLDVLTSVSSCSPQGLESTIDPNTLTSLKDIKEAYASLCEEERAVEERLEWSVTNRHQLEARLAQVAKLLPALQVVHADACQLRSTISFTHQLANTVSARVRHLDTAKGGVVAVQCRVADLLDLEGCAGGVSTALAQEDFETAAAHIHRFLAMDEKLLLSSAGTPATTGGRSIGTWFARLRAADAELSVLIAHRFDEAVRAEDSASVDRFFKLFPLLNRPQDGLDRFSAFLCASVQVSGAAALQRAVECPARGARAHVKWADAATELFEAVARIVEVRQPIIETYYGPGKLGVVALELVRETERQAGRIIKEMTAHRRLHQLTAAAAAALSSGSGGGGGAGGTGSSAGDGSALPDPRHLDTLLGELTLLNARADLFLRFMRRRVVADLESSIIDPEELSKQVKKCETQLWRSQLAVDMAEVIGMYTSLEQYYLNQSFAKALTLDTTGTAATVPVTLTPFGGGEEEEGDEPAHVSSIVDDAFYIIKKSVRRAIASSSADGVCAVLNHAVRLIETQLAPTFRHTLSRGFPAQGGLDIQQAYSALQSSLHGKVNTSASDADLLRHRFLTALNSAETSQRHVQSLQRGLADAVAATMTNLSDTSRAMIDSCLADLGNSGQTLAAVVAVGLKQLRATAVKPRVKALMTAFTATQHDITEEEFAYYSANAPFSSAVMVSVDGVVGSFRPPMLTRANHEALTTALVQEIADHLEHAMAKTVYNRYGGLLVDREVRAMAGYLSQVAQWGVREQLARVTQMATLLNLDHLHEVDEYSSSSTWRLTPAEMRKTLQLRVDFKYEDIKRLKL